MLTKCANPDCSKQFHYMNEGRVFRVEAEAVIASTGLKKPNHHVEHFWLCGDCSRTMTVGMTQDRTVVMVPIPAVAPAKTRQAAA